MTAARPLTAAERATLAAKLAKMQAAVERKATTRRARAVAIRAAQEEVTQVDVAPCALVAPGVVDGRYAFVMEGK